MPDLPLKAYRILVPEDCGGVLRFVARELQRLIGEAAGLSLEITEREGGAADEAYLSLGRTRLYDRYRSLFGPCGGNTSAFEIHTVGSHILIKGNTEYADLYGAYAFLEKQFGIEFYASDEIRIPVWQGETLQKLELAETPSIEYRHIGFFDTMKHAASACRFRSLSNYEPGEQASDGKYDAVDGEVYYRVWGGMFSHTMLQTLPVQRDGEGKPLHPDWYSQTLNQLCLTNHEVKRQYLANLKEHILRFSNAKIFMLGIMDNGDYCTCHRCREAYAKYGGPSAVHVLFIREVAEEIRGWQREELPDSGFLLGAFAYNWTRKAPVHFSAEHNRLLPDDAKFVLPDNVAVMIAPLDACALHAIDAPCNHEVKERFEEWSVLAEHLLVWDYHEFFNNYFVYLPSVEAYRDNIRFYAAHGVKLVYCEGNLYGEATGFQALKSYLLSKLLWNCEQEAQPLIEAFFRNYYGEAGRDMYEYFTMLNRNYARLEKLYDGLGPRGYHTAYDTKDQPDALTSVHWDKEFLSACERVLNRALNALSALKDEERGRKLQKRVKLETLMVKYLLIELHTYYCGKAEADARIDEFERLAYECGVERLCHWGSLLKEPNPQWLVRTKIREWRYRYPARRIEK